MKPLHIISAIRTPFTRAGTVLAGQDAVDLGKAAVSALLTRGGFDPQVVDEVIFGCVGQPAHAQNIARVIALRSGIPEARPAMTVHRNCASGLEALTTAHAKMCAGQGEVFLVGGTESMSNMPLYFSRQAAEKFGTLGKARGIGQKLGALTSFRPADFAPIIGLKLGLTDPVVEMNMGETAELLAREFHISRDMQDAFALRSHQRAAAAQAAGKFDAEIVPLNVTIKVGEGSTVKETSIVFKVDEGVRRDSSAEALAKLKPAFAMKGTVTAGNSSQTSDGAAALLIMSEEKAKALGLKPLARFVSFAVGGVPPEVMGIGPVAAVPKALKYAGMDLKDIDLIELNEAFAAQGLAVVRELGMDEEKVNVNGGAIALGHPLGCTGAKLTVQIIHELQRQGKETGLVTMCIGGGMGAAGIVQLVG